MTAANIATHRNSQPQASDSEMQGSDAYQRVGDAVAANSPACDTATADVSLDYWYFCSDESPYRAG